MHKPLLLIALAVAGLSACTAGTTTATETQTQTITAAPSPSYTSTPAWGDGVDTPAADPATPAQPVVQVNPEAKACGLVRHAQTLPAFSSRWDSIVFNAEDAAKSDGAYKLIYKAENEVFGPGFSYESEARADLKEFVTKYC